uniref:Uncharacterized protein LOC105046447 n=2 Tax=Elaeis guineensis var. tenera TaxID=51953 RepID=A0A6I9RB04_ELAGV|nr:uncharacterized protein LOC105046447 [Elaeis guineensis]
MLFTQVQGRAMATSLRLVLLPLLLSAVMAAAGVVGSAVHDVLPEYGLPRGLLPDSVKSYSLSPSGEFEVELKAPCYVQFSDLVYYEKKIKGKLAYGKISDLSGIQAKKLFIWVSVSGIEAHPDDGTVEFKVGFLSETLPASDFELVPTCKAKASCRGAAGLVSEGLRISQEFHSASENPVF